MTSVGDVFADELGALSADRAAHSRAVGDKAARFVGNVEAALRSDVVAAATLHDIGYGHPDSGFHPLDGARYLAALGFSPVVCHLVVHHSASAYEARERGIDLAVYRQFNVDRELGAAHAVIWWADMTTGPQGQDVEVEQRLDEICDRYGPGDVVTRFITRARPVLLEAGQSPTGSIHVSE